MSENHVHAFFVRMPVTPLEIVDSAVKIGLGALISGFATFIAAKVGSKKDLDKEKLTRQLQMVQDVATKVDTFHTAMMDYVCSCPVLGGAENCPVEDPFVKGRLRIQGDIGGEELTKFRRKRQLARDASTHLGTARSALILLGYGPALKALRIYKDAAESFWLAVGDSEKPLDSTEFVNMKTLISKAHTGFYNELSKVFPIGLPGFKEDS